MTVVRRNEVNMVMSLEWCQAPSKCLGNTRYFLFKKYTLLAQGTVAELMGRLSLQKELVFKVSKCPGCPERAPWPPGVSLSPPQHEEHDSCCPHCKAVMDITGDLRGKHGGGEAGQTAPSSAIASPAKGASEQLSLGSPRSISAAPWLQAVAGTCSWGLEHTGKGAGGRSTLA